MASLSWPTILAEASSTRYMYSVIELRLSLALCRLQGCKDRPDPFPGRMSYKATNPGSVCPLS